MGACWRVTFPEEVKKYEEELEWHRRNVLPKQVIIHMNAIVSKSRRRGPGRQHVRAQRKQMHADARIRDGSRRKLRVWERVFICVRLRCRNRDGQTASGKVRIRTGIPVYLPGKMRREESLSGSSRDGK